MASWIHTLCNLIEESSLNIISSLGNSPDTFLAHSCLVPWIFYKWLQPADSFRNSTDPFSLVSLGGTPGPEVEEMRQLLCFPFGSFLLRTMENPGWLSSCVQHVINILFSLWILIWHPALIFYIQKRNTAKLYSCLPSNTAVGIFLPVIYKPMWMSERLSHKAQTTVLLKVVFFFKVDLRKFLIPFY